jgi:hypothetical protein
MPPPWRKRRQASLTSTQSKIVIKIGLTYSMPDKLFSTKNAKNYPAIEASPSPSLTPGYQRKISYSLCLTSLFCTSFRKPPRQQGRWRYAASETRGFLRSARKNYPKAPGNGCRGLIFFLAPSWKAEIWRVKGGLRARAWGLGISR